MHCDRLPSVYECQVLLPFWHERLALQAGIASQLCAERGACCGSVVCRQATSLTGRPKTAAFLCCFNLCAIAHSILSEGKHALGRTGKNSCAIKQWCGPPSVSIISQKVCLDFWYQRALYKQRTLSWNVMKFFFLCAYTGCPILSSKSNLSYLLDGANHLKMYVGHCVLNSQNCSAFCQKVQLNFLLVFTLSVSNMAAALLNF